MRRTFFAALTLAALLLAACAGGPAAAPAGGTGSDMTLPQFQPVDLGGRKLRVVATTSIVGDVVGNVGGDHIDLTVLIQTGQDPHSYQPVPQDLAAAEQADVVFVNGVNLEENLLNSLAATSKQPLVPVSAGVTVIKTVVAGQGETPGGDDPHVWTDPHNVIMWANNIATVLSELDPANADAYHANAAAYVKQLNDLDTYLQDQTATIPADKRVLVTNHETLGYFAARYGYTIVGTVYIGASALAEPSAADMAALVDAINKYNVPAIFVETTVSSQLAQTLAGEIGRPIGVYTLYSDSLGAPGSGADTYISMMRSNMDTIVKGLTGG